ncbi:MAG: tetratricopeptide repeat protein [Longimicrobiales bacterium]
MTKRHPGTRRVTNDSHDNDPDDVFIAKTLELSGWAKNNQQVITVLIVVAVLAVAGLVYYRNYSATLTQQAAQQLETIHQTVALQDREGAKADLGTFLQRFDGTPYAGEARMMLGELYLQTNEAQQALAVLEPMAASPREPLEFQAAALLGAAYEQEGRWADAEAVYLRIADRSDLDFQVRDALESAARIRARQGDTAGAATLYQRILDGLEEGDQVRGLYEMRLAELTT